VAAVGIVVVSVALNGAWYMSRSAVADKKAADVLQRTQRIAELEKVIGEVNNINKRKKEVEDKLRVLTDLRKSRSGPVRLLDALASATPKKVWLRTFEEKDNNVKLTGGAFSHEDVAEFMRALNSVVWTPKGIGRWVEKRRDSKTSRVELLAANGAVEDFPDEEATHFFANINLQKAEQKEVKSPTAGAGKIVDFEIALNSNYAL
jgi:type IV pilus assembly protein PilN